MVQGTYNVFENGAKGIMDIIVMKGNKALNTGKKFFS